MDWKKYHEIINGNDWYISTSEMNKDQKLNYLYNTIESSVNKIFKKKDGNFKTKRKIPRNVKNYYQGKKSYRI